MLARENRLKKDNDFRRVFQSGKVVRDNLFVMRFVGNNLEKTRFGFVVGFKFSKKAVVRNRARRLFGEAVRKLNDRIKPGHDIIIIPKNVAGVTQERIIGKLADALKEAGIYG